MPPTYHKYSLITEADLSQLVRVVAESQFLT